MDNNLSNLELIVRPAALTDLPALLVLLKQLYALEEDYTFESEKQACGLELIMASANGQIFAAELGGEVVGMCLAQVIISTAEGAKSAWVEDVVVSEKCRGFGVGSKIMEAVDKWARDNGIARLQLLADRDNEPALKFYLKRNWQEMNSIAFKRFPLR